MLPVGICWSVTKKMGTTQMLGIVLGLTLVSGQLLNAYAVAGTAAADIPKWNFGFVQVDMIGYQQFWQHLRWYILKNSSGRSVHP